MLSRRVPSPALAMAVVLGFALAVVAVAAAPSGGSARATALRPAAHAASGPVPAGFGPQAFTAISDQTWWLLGSAPCASPPCTSIVRTENGGASFVGLPAPRTTQVDSIMFADSLDAFAYGPQLWVTHDGGEIWYRLSLGGSVYAMASAGGFTYAIVSGANGTGHLQRARVGSDLWTSLAGAGSAFSGLWAHGADLLLESEGSLGDPDELMISHNDGASFTRDTAPPNVACDFEEQAWPVIWAHCATGMLSDVLRSVDGGARFPVAEGSGSKTLPELPNSAAFAAASSREAVAGYDQLYVTTDGGRAWERARGPAGITWWSYLGFTDATHGAAIGYVGTETPSHERLYYTTNGGRSYRLVHIAG